MNDEELTALLEYVNEKKKEKALIDFQQKQLEKDITEAELMLQKYLTDNKIEVKESGIFSFGWKVTQRNSFNQKAFSEEHQDLWEQYKMPTEVKKFQILVNGR